MDPLLVDWIGLILRWAHVMFGIAWIGTSFYFIWLDGSLRRRAHAREGVAGESWMLHGGGFYRVEKYSVAPARLPEELHWFKYEAYFTWISGFLLLAAIYYWSAEAFLIDPASGLSPALAIAISVGSLIVGWLAYDLICRSPLGRQTAVLAAAVFVLIVLAAWGYGTVFTGRAAFLHVGALVGTVMAANVFFIIIPNQKKTVAALKAGEVPDARLGRQAKQRSFHNTYLTLPVVLMMVSNHYPVLYGRERGALVVAGIVILGGLVRHYVTCRESGRKDASYPFLIPAAVATLAVLVAFSSYRPDAAGKGETVAFAQVQSVIVERCASCHSARPTDEDFAEAPGEVVFDTPGDIKAHAQRILTQSVLTDSMPLGNKTGMTPEERQLLGAWIAQGAPLD